MYTSEQITVLELLEADKPSFSRKGMFWLVENMLCPGDLTESPYGKLKPFPKRKFASLRPLPEGTAKYAMRLRQLMNLEFPLRQVGDHQF